jgi:hypothetical protein
VEIVYFDHARSDEAQEGFGHGDAGKVWLGDHGIFESDSRVRISGNSYHALLGHGVVGRLAVLPVQFGPIGEGRDAVLQPSVLESAARILYEADRMIYGASFEFSAGTTPLPAPREYRVVVDNREYQRTLARLQFLMSSAAREGHAVRLRLASVGCGLTPQPV